VEKMKNKIAKILEGNINTWGDRNANDLTEEILELLEEEGWMSPEEVARKNGEIERLNAELIHLSILYQYQMEVKK